MAFVEADRVQLRHFLGFGALFLQADPRLENAITAVQSTADGGTRPTNDTELAIKSILTNLATLETNLSNLWVQAQVSKADETMIDAYRGMMMLRAEGRRLVRGLEGHLSTTKRHDVFSGSRSNAEGDTFAESLSASGGKRW